MRELAVLVCVCVKEGKCGECSKRMFRRLLAPYFRGQGCPIERLALLSESDQI